MKTFFNVGNGLFVVEEVYGKIFVFDCGGDGIKCAIQRAFIHKNTKIEAVFISHFDRDHINGIHFLLSQCNVKRLVLPLLKESLKILFLTDQLSILDREFIFDTENYVKKVSNDTDICFVSPDINGDNGNNNSPITLDNLRNHIFSGQRIIVKNNEKDDDDEAWLFIPSYLSLFETYEVDRLIQEVINLYKEKGVIEKSWCIKDIWKKYDLHKGLVLKNAIMNCVGNLTLKNINNSSLTVFSNSLYSINKKIKTGCLYLGDYNAKDYINELKDVYLQVWDSMGIVQIPHHGSVNNFTSELVNNSIIAIISVSALNPSVTLGNITHDIALKGGIPLYTSCKGDIHILNDKYFARGCIIYRYMGIDWSEI